MSINLGNIVGGRLIGISSGLDSEAVISDLEEIKRIPINIISDTIDFNTNKISKFTELKSLLNNLKNVTNVLRNPAGISSNNLNAFEYKTASLRSSTITTVSNYLSVTAKPGALNGITDIEIGNIAKALEQRSASFNSRNADATTTATGSYFSTGAFSIGSGKVIAVDGAVSSSDTLSANEYIVDGDASGILTSAGVHNITVTGGDGGLSEFIGGISGFSGSYNSGSITLTVEVNGKTFTSNAVSANDSINAGANNGITSGTTITFTADSGGDNEMSFDITTASDIIIDEDEDNTITFLDDLETALGDQNIYQSREIENFNASNIKSPLTGLTSDNIKINSNNFGTNYTTIGDIEGFEVTYSGGSDGVISVEIGNEVYKATGLGTTLDSNLTLTSTTSDKTLSLNLGDAALSIDISDSTNAQSLERALDYALGTRKIIDVTISAGDTLNDIAYNINQFSNQTGLNASILEVSSSDYRLVLKSNSVGIDNSYEFFDDSGVLTNANITNTQDAENALIKIDGLEVERSTNNITDVLENTTLSLLQVTPDYGGVSAESIELTVGNDIDTVIDAAIIPFMEAYNALRVFFSEQTERDVSTLAYTEDAILGGDSILTTLFNSLSNEIVNTISGTNDSNFSSILNVGIEVSNFDGDDETIATSNILNYDDTELRENLLNNFDKIREIFEFQLTVDNTSLAIFKTSNSATLQDFRIDIDTSRGVGQEAQLLDTNGDPILDDEGNAIYFEYSNGKLTGADDTVVEGLEFIYSGDGVDTINVSYTQGVADRLYNLIDSYTKNDGIIDAEVDTISEANDNKDSEIITLEERLEVYVESLRKQYAALEAAISSVNNIIAFLEADAAERTK